jgi:hypothetical protein
MVAPNPYSKPIYCSSSPYLICCFILFSYSFFAKCQLVVALRLFSSIIAYINREAFPMILYWNNSFLKGFTILLIVSRCYKYSICFYLRNFFLSFLFLNFHINFLLLLWLTRLQLLYNHLFDWKIVNLKNNFFNCAYFILWKVSI